MRYSRWLDHVPPWLSFGALASTGVFEPGEVVGMAAPLVAAGVVEALRLDLERWRRGLEIGTVALILLDALRRPGLIPVVVHTLFLLCAARLALPRELPQRRQILLMAFLLFLTTSLTTVDLAFMVWGLAWTAASAAVLLQLAWEQSAHYRRGPALRPPFRRLLPWSLATLVMATAFFLILPRVTLGLRPFGFGIASVSGSQAGFSSRLELNGGGAVAPNADVVMRIVPPPGQSPAFLRSLEAELGLWRGLGLNQFDGRRWESREPQSPRILAIQESGLDPDRALECYLTSTPMGIVPLPYGSLVVETSSSMPMRRDSVHGAIRWVYPQGNRYSLRLQVTASPTPLQEAGPQGKARAILTYAGSEETLVGTWSRRMAPGNLPPLELASQLTGELRSRFRYTLDNPSGTAANPLEDFLERSQAGHCEYFASALALMLRVRGVPARVVNGYRLGPWIPEGGYWLVTQNEAHSWVEFFDGDAGWRVADPTPPAPPSAVLSPSLAATLARWMDAARFRWDRHVVRFSGEDQQAGMSWIQTRAASFRMPEVGDLLQGLTTSRGLGNALLGVGLAWLLWRTRTRWLPFFPRRRRRGLVVLRPLLRQAGPDLEPREGETARHWLTRLAKSNPERQTHLDQLAALVDAVAYGGGDVEARLRAMVREEARHWHRWVQRR